MEVPYEEFNTGVNDDSHNEHADISNTTALESEYMATGMHRLSFRG